MHKSPDLRDPTSKRGLHVGRTIEAKRLGTELTFYGKDFTVQVAVEDTDFEAEQLAKLKQFVQDIERKMA